MPVMHAVKKENPQAQKTRSENGKIATARAERASN